MAPGEKNKFGNPIFEPVVFRKQMYCIEEITCDIVRICLRPSPVIRRFHGYSAFKELCPLPPIITPLHIETQRQIYFSQLKNFSGSTRFCQNLVVIKHQVSLASKEVASV